jgi:hypothetical protein
LSPLFQPRLHLGLPMRILTELTSGLGTLAPGERMGAKQ